MARLRPLALGLAAALGMASPAPAREALEAGVPPAVVPVAAFPIAGEYEYGGHATYFGGGRDHEGQDVFAECGTPLVAAAAGRVLVSKYHGAAGHYVVIGVADGGSHVYAHLRASARVREGERVLAGESLGAVGDSGNAWDCHLHFETWTAPGWYRGGRAVNPLPYLRALG